MNNNSSETFQSNYCYYYTQPEKQDIPLIIIFFIYIFTFLIFLWDFYLTIN